MSKSALGDKQIDTYVYDIGNSRYINLTDKCTLRCAFCPKFNGSFDVHEYNLRMKEEPVVDELIHQIGDPTQFDEIVFCGFGESTLRIDELIAVSRAVKQKGGRIRVNTDGLGNLANEFNILEKMKGHVDALSISLNAQNEQVYNQHCRPMLNGSYVALLKFIQSAPNYIDDVTVTAISGLEGVDIDACEKIAADSGVKFKVRYLDDVG